MMTLDVFRPLIYQKGIDTVCPHMNIARPGKRPILIPERQDLNTIIEINLVGKRSG